MGTGRKLGWGQEWRVGGGVQGPDQSLRSHIQALGGPQPARVHVGGTRLFPSFRQVTLAREGRGGMPSQGLGRGWGSGQRGAAAGGPLREGCLPEERERKQTALVSSVLCGYK